MSYRGKLEYAHERRIRERNTRIYRLAHWPIWIWVFFLAPGPLTFSLFAHGFSRGNFAWLVLVLVVFFVGYAVVYLGWHWFADAIGGLLLGLTLLFGLIAYLERKRTTNPGHAAVED